MAKAELKTKPTEVSAADFIAGLPDARRRASGTAAMNSAGDASVALVLS